MGRAKPAARGRVKRSRAAAFPGSIRIIGGRWRSRRLAVMTSAGLRPTPDRVRETLFNWLAPCIVGARCLDLFAGTGALCLEALSRGAAEAVMVERSPEVLHQLHANIDLLGAAGAVVVEREALDYLHESPRGFDIVFLDPPFAVATEMIRDCGERLVHGWLRPGGLVYVEAPRTLGTLPLPANLLAKKNGVAGLVNYQLFQVLPPG